MISIITRDIVNLRKGNESLYRFQLFMHLPVRSIHLKFAEFTVTDWPNTKHQIYIIFNPNNQIFQSLNCWAIINDTVQSIIIYLWSLFRIAATIVFDFWNLTENGVTRIRKSILSNHYMITEGHKTYSYYGSLKFIGFNYNCHNEHHNLPTTPWNYSTDPKKIAAKFHDSVTRHTSSVRIFYYLVMELDLGAYTLTSTSTSTLCNFESNNFLVNVFFRESNFSSN